MADAIFGKSITRQFYPLENGEPINLPSQAPDIYLFSELGNVSDMILGTGAFDRIQYWTESATRPYLRQYVINAIQDPVPGESTREKTYYELINYVAQSAGQSQYHLREITVERALATESVPDTSISDMKEIYPGVDDFCSDVELSAHLSNAEEEVKLGFESKGFEWGKIKGLKKARLSLAYKALQIACESLIVNDGDRFAIKAITFRDRYNDFMKVLKFDYDSDADGTIDAKVENDPSFVFFGK